MSPLVRHAFLIFLTLVAAALGGAAWGQTDAAAGRFLAVTGEVSVLGRDGAQRTAERGSELRAGETVRTSDNALAQMRMTDGSLLSLRSGSEFKLEQFSFAGQGDSNASFVMSVLKGGFRTITGLIAQSNRRGYRITTPAATIGVRGTHFEVVHVLPQTAAPEAPAGTYNRVYEGITTFQNPTGVQLLVNREQTAFTALQPGAAPVLVAPPAAIFGRPTPIPRAAAPLPQAPTRAEGQGRGEAQLATPAGRPALPAVREGTPPLRAAPVETSTTLRTLQPVPTTTIAPTTLTPLEPTTALRTLEPTTTTILQSPTMTTISPTTTLSPTTTTTIAPTTTTIQSTTTTIQSTTTTILKQPTTTVSPLLTR